MNLEVPVHAGDTLWTLGTYGSWQVRSPVLHWEIFSEENLLPGFEKAEDASSGFQLRAKTIFDLVKQRFLGKDDDLDAEESRAFFRSDPGAARLRRFACRFMAEGAVDPDAAVKDLTGRWFTRGLADRLRPYAWWREAEATGVPLPRDPHVWHYNPISFVEVVGRLTERVPPMVKPRAAPVAAAAAPAVSADGAFKLPVTPGLAADVWALEGGQRVPHFCQGSDPWGLRKLGSAPSAATIKAAGCAITSVAMCLKFYGHPVDPRVVDEYLDDHAGYSGDSVMWQVAFDAGSTPGKKRLAFAAFVNDKAQFGPTLDARLAANLPTIAWVDYGNDSNASGNHFVVVVGRLQSGEYVMNDPAASGGNGAADPSDDNQLNKTSRAGGYSVVKLITFTATAPQAA